MRAQQLLRLHREEVAIEHGCRLDERLRERDGRQLERKSARLQHAALHILGPRPQVRVALIDVAPRVDDRDDGAAAPVHRVVAHLTKARAVAEGPQVLHPQPTVGPQLLRRFASAVGHTSPVSSADITCWSAPLPRYRRSGLLPSAREKLRHWYDTCKCGASNIRLHTRMD